MNQVDEIKYRVCVQDIILIIVVLVGSLWFLLGFTNASDNGQNHLLVYRNGEVIKDLEMNREQIINLSLDQEEMNIEIKADKGVCVSHSSCPAKICVHMGWIKQSGETIICLPNKVLLEIKGEKSEYHAISY